MNGSTPTKGVTARELNDIVAAFPNPGQAVQLMGLQIGDCPILFHEISTVDAFRLLGDFIWEGRVPFPIFYMPLNMMERWGEDETVQAFVKWLNEHGMDIQLMVGGSSTWLRGHWVLLCDMRLRFVADVPQVAFEEIKLLTSGEG
jgi:hypothetical protein